MNDNTLRISIIKAFVYFISNQKYAIFLEKWELNTKELYCAGHVNFFNTEWGEKHNLQPIKIYSRYNFVSKDKAEYNYYEELYALQNIVYLEDATIFNDIKNAYREYYIDDIDLERYLYSDPYGDISNDYKEFMEAYKNGVQN